LSDLESFFREKTSSHQHVMSRRETFWKPGERMFCIFKHFYHRKAIQESTRKTVSSSGGWKRSTRKNLYQRYRLFNIL
jgi:hypothetical protein